MLMAKQALYSIHIRYFPEDRIILSLLLRYLFHCGRTYLFCSAPYFNCDGPEVGARGKEEVLPQPDGSVPSGGTVLYLLCL